LHLAQFLVGRVAQRDPDEASRASEPLVDILDLDVGQLLSVLLTRIFHQ
jgi:hypothetical protein